jgi:hypothetical protein
MLGDEVLASALLGRLLYKCEVIKLTGKSYRLEHPVQPSSNNSNRRKEEPNQHLLIREEP